MKMDKLQKRILIILIILCLMTPVGIFLPAFFDAGEAWGEWSARTLQDMIGYVPHGLAKYSAVWKAPMTGYSISGGGSTAVHQSGFYIVSGIIGATIAYVAMLLISRLIFRNGK